MNLTSEDIHFVGDWTDPDRQRMERVLTSFETAWSRSSRPPTGRAPSWIVVRELPPWGPYYFAHRLGTYDSLVGRSVEELAEVIEESGREL